MNKETNYEESWVSKNTFYYEYLKIESNKITSENVHAFVSGSSILSNIFKITIKVESIQDHIGFGIWDVSNIPLQESQHSFISYFDNSEIFKYPEENEKKLSFEKFKIGDFVTVIGCLDDGIIGFKINGFTVGTTKFKKMKDKTVNWVPFIYLSKLSSVRIVESFHSANQIPVFFCITLFDWDEDLIYEIHNLMPFSDEDEE